MSDNKREWLGYVSPILTVILGFYLSSVEKEITQVSQEIREVRGEISHHLQNSELHIPRATIVNRDEWMIYQTMRDKQMGDIKDRLGELKIMLDEHRRGSEK